MWHVDPKSIWRTPDDAVMDAFDPYLGHNYILINQVFLEMKCRSFGWPTWFVDRENAEVVSSLIPKSFDLTGVVWPYTAFTIVFEKGVLIGGSEVKYIRVASQYDSVAAKTKVVYFAATSLGDFGGALPLNCKSIGVTPVEKCAFALVSFVCCVMLLWAWRPEIYKPYTLPRNQRYQFKGDHSKHRRLMMPTEKIVHTGERSINEMPEDDCQRIRAHYRSAVIAIYRKRIMPDGQPQVVIRKPCWVNLDENDLVNVGDETEVGE